MPMSYYKVFTVPVWVVMEPNNKERTVMSWFKSKGAREQIWPSTGFKDTVLSFAKKGWNHVFPKKKDEVFFIPAQLIMMAMAEHVRRALGDTSILSFNFPVHRLDRKIRTDVDYDRIFNEVFETQSDIVLSQAFQVAENCHREDIENTHVWITQGECSKNVLTRIARRVITIGEDDSCTIDISNVKAKQLPNYLEEKFSEIMSAI